MALGDLGLFLQQRSQGGNTILINHGLRSFRKVSLGVVHLCLLVESGTNMNLTTGYVREGIVSQASLLFPSRGRGRKGGGKESLVT